MRAMGIRAEKDCFNYVVVENVGNNPALVEAKKIRAPKIGSDVAALSNFRERVLSLIQLHKPDVFSLKRPETYGRRNKNVGSLDARLRIEGVLLEAANSVKLFADAKQWRQVGAGMKSSSPKDYMEEQEVRGITLPTKDPEMHEALLVALAALGT